MQDDRRLVIFVCRLPRLVENLMALFVTQRRLECGDRLRVLLGMRVLAVLRRFAPLGVRPLDLGVVKMRGLPPRCRPGVRGGLQIARLEQGPRLACTLSQTNTIQSTVTSRTTTRRMIYTRFGRRRFLRGDDCREERMEFCLCEPVIRSSIRSHHRIPSGCEPRADARMRAFRADTPNTKNRTRRCGLHACRQPNAGHIRWRRARERASSR